MSAPTRVASTPANVRSGNFDPTADPVARVEPGGAVEIETVYGSDAETLLEAGVEREEILADEVRHHERPHEGPGPHAVTGPIHVEGAAPGDVLAVRVRAVRLRTSYGINHFRPGRGVLPDDFPEPHRRVIRIDRERGVARFGGGVELPVDPFFGIMAVAPPVEVGPVSTLPPASIGGNLDVALLGAGSTVYLPVEAPGGLFYVGDGHAVQGDGEVCLTALETSLTGVFEFGLHEDVPGLRHPVAETDRAYVAIGLGDTLDDALQHAVREAVGLLVAQRGLTPPDAYRFCSLAVDFAVSQAVNGTVGVHGRIPKAVFEDPGPIEPERFREPRPVSGGRRPPGR